MYSLRKNTHICFTVSSPYNQKSQTKIGIILKQMQNKQSQFEKKTTIDVEKSIGKDVTKIKRKYVKSGNS